MDLIYMNAEKEDVGAMHDYVLDLAFGSDENDFECKMVINNHCCEEDFFLYYEGSEYGGIIDDIEVDTEADEITYTGRTWHGILNSKILEPDAGEDYLILSGEANAVIASLVSRMGLEGLFVASGDDSGINISDYQMNRYIAGYDGIMKMLKASGAKLNIAFNNGFVELSAKPIIDYTLDDQFDTDQISFRITKKGNPLNHVICLGKGDLSAREVIHVYADSNGNISEKQVLTGVQEVCRIYDNANAESSDELMQGGIDLIHESWNSNKLEYDFEPDSEGFDIGDIVGARESITGISIKTEISKKIVTFNNGELSIAYECDKNIIDMKNDKTALLGTAIVGKMVLGTE